MGKLLFCTFLFTDKVRPLKNLLKLVYNGFNFNTQGTSSKKKTCSLRVHTEMAYSIIIQQIDSHHAYIWSERQPYPSSINNRYPRIYRGCQDLSENLQSKLLYNHTFSSREISFVDNLLDI